MSELATMAALKISNSINQHYQQQNQESLTPTQSHTPNIPFSVQSPHSSSSSVATTTATNKNFSTNSNTNNTNITNSVTTNPESPDASLIDGTLSRQASTDAAPSSSIDYEDYTTPNHTLSTSTSGIYMVNFCLFIFIFAFGLFW